MNEMGLNIDYTRLRDIFINLNHKVFRITNFFLCYFLPIQLELIIFTIF